MEHEGSGGQDLAFRLKTRWNSAYDAMEYKPECRQLLMSEPGAALVLWGALDLLANVKRLQEQVRSVSGAGVVEAHVREVAAHRRAVP